MVMSAGIPIVFLGGFIIHFVVGVKLLPNVPTLRERFGSKADVETE
jgi:hypothetical protein